MTKNEFGILDHVAILTDGTMILNIMRVVGNGEESEVMFILFQLSTMTDQQFAEDVKMVEADLQSFKEVMERNCSKETIEP